jgi:hypothetical protein
MPKQAFACEQLQERSMSETKPPELSRSDVDKELEQLMGEIQNLQKGMSDMTQTALTQAASPAAAATTAPAPVTLPVLEQVSPKSPVSLVPEAEASLPSLEELEAPGVGELSSGEAVEAKDEGDMSDFRGAANDASMEETLGALPEEESEEEVAHQNSQFTVSPASVSSSSPQAMPASDPYLAKVVPMVPVSPSSPSSQSEPTSAEGSLTMTLTGSMKLKLQYDYEGQTITVGFIDGALKVELADGTEFKVPVNRSAARKQSTAA